MKPETIDVVRWIARIWGSLSVAFLLFMIIGHVIDPEVPFLSGFHSTREVIIFLLFPVSTMIGIWMAWPSEFWGSLFTLVGISGLFALRQDLLFDPWISIIIAPAFIYLFVWWLDRHSTETMEELP